MKAKEPMKRTPHRRRSATVRYGRPVAPGDRARARPTSRPLEAVGRAGAEQRPAPPRDCLYLGDCTTYEDPMVPRATKSCEGRGCLCQTDAYRARHCKVFASRGLVEMFAQALAPPQAGREGP